MNDKVNVTLTGPAKVNGVREPAGKTVTVSTTLALQLAASGVINPEAAQALSAAISETQLGSDFDAAVRAAVADREANWATAMDHFETMAEDREIALEKRLEKAGADIGELIASQAELEGELVAARAALTEAQASLTALARSGEHSEATDQPEGGDTPPADGAADNRKAGKKPAPAKT